jgi:excinuclease ABC subunit C
MDGGSIQVNSCLNALNDINVSIPVWGLVKDDNHKTNNLLFNDKIIEIEKSSNLFRLLTQIQDEVHRFAITYFHNTHSKNLFSSELDKIKGIGKVKKTQILKLLNEPDFEEKLKTLKLNETQIQEVLKALKK